METDSREEVVKKAAEDVATVYEERRQLNAKYKDLCEDLISKMQELRIEKIVTKDGHVVTLNNRVDVKVSYK